MYQFNREEYEKRVAWFTQARFGMFIHWGLYAIPARGRVGAQRRAHSQGGLHALFLRV